MNNNGLENAAQYLMLFALCLLGASLIGLAMGLIKIGLTLASVNTPL